MNIAKRAHGKVVVLDVDGKLAGKLGGGVGLSELAMEQLAEAASASAADPRQVLLNLAGCTGADSLGIGELISLHVSLSNRGGVLKLLHLPERIRDLLRATQLISMFEIFEDEGAALQSFG